ncbi:MAG: 2-hydroxyacyl-CoA dehydratase [Candidatus Bathyarchaeota archaeon]|nr:MAG: 2-hydroxyacyl-CoA dehydratase [Candidatus Bathyarchaeota archaeon]
MEALDELRNLFSARHDIVRDWKRQGKHVVGWASTYTPEEILYAASILPMRILGSPETAKLAHAYCPDNMCSFCRSCFDVALKGDYDYLDGFVTSASCDNREKMYDLWRHHVEIPYFYFINTPHTNTNTAHEFFYDELVRFRESLEKAFRTPISDQSLRKAVRIYNENRVLLKKLYNLRRKDPPLISGREALETVLSSMLTPKEVHSRLLTQLLKEIPQRDDPPTKGVRLLISGSVMDDAGLLEIVEATGGSVVADDLSTGSRYFWNSVDPTAESPLFAIARRYLDRVPCPFMGQSEDRFRHVQDMVKRYDVEGVIIFVLRFCDPHLFDAPLLKAELESSGLPVLYLEWEHAMTGFAQLRTRIEAFLEMIRGVG